IQAVPSFLIKHDLEKVILGVIDDIRSENSNSDFNQRKEKILTYMACRSAVKFGDSLSLEEMQALVKQLEKSESKFSCPHGRPSMIILEKSELWARFGRKYTGFADGERFRGINC
ncbi:hypothetical protein GF376_00640, partial [Candidatus Peregrinibacteria bacterium]|nr:hypothetical protein [Candidatus Peregrinibacteria bacterium]